MKLLSVGALLVLGAFAAPLATADPAPLPDLSGYTVANDKEYATYYNYPTTGGDQFRTPGGYRCRITFTGKANHNSASCWGALPGTAFNSVRVGAGITVEPATFADADLSAFEHFTAPPGPGSDDKTTDQTVKPEAYKPLPVGRKLTYPDSGTCGVTSTTTTCLLGEHGFVLKPDGSQAF